MTPNEGTSGAAAGRGTRCVRIGGYLCRARAGTMGHGLRLEDRS